MDGDEYTDGELRTREPPPLEYSDPGLLPSFPPLFGRLCARSTLLLLLLRSACSPPTRSVVFRGTRAGLGFSGEASDGDGRTAFLVSFDTTTFASTAIEALLVDSDICCGEYSALKFTSVRGVE